MSVMPKTDEFLGGCSEMHNSPNMSMPISSQTIQKLTSNLVYSCPQSLTDTFNIIKKI